MKIINNEAIDFIFALNRFGIRKKDLNLDYPSMDELDTWCKEYENKVSPFLLNDISLFSEKTVLITMYFFEIIHSNSNINSALDFLKYINNINPKKLKSDIISKYFNNQVSEITVDNIYNAMINDGLHPGYDMQEEAQLLYGVIIDTENFLPRLQSTYSQFYKQIYLPSVNKFHQINEEKFIWHRKRMAEDQKKYLIALGLNSIINEISNINEITFYYSFFADNEISSLWNAKIVVIGASTDKRIIQKSAKSKSDLFFNCLGDPKRLEILRLTADRPWYSSELASHFKLKPATLSYHINKLVEADLLFIRKGEIKRFYYTLNKEAFDSYLDFVSQDLLGEKRIKK